MMFLRVSVEQAGERLGVDAEAAKPLRERRWYPIVIGTALVGAGATLAKLLG